MTAFRSFRSRAGHWSRALTALVVVAGAVTCDSPTAPRRVTLAIAPSFGSFSLTGFAGMVVDSVRLSVIRQPSDTILRKTFAFAPDSSQITASASVTLNASREQLLVALEFLSASQVVFTGSQLVDVSAGVATAPTQIPVAYTGPGKSIATIRIAPRDTGVVSGASVPYSVTATDSASQPVSQFYVSWSAGRTGDVINAAGVLKAGGPGTGWVYAHTPTGIWDSTRVIVAAGAPASIVKTAGDGQSAPAGSAVAVAPQVRVLDAQNNPVPNVQVQFAVTSGGGTVAGGSVLTDAGGFAQPGSWTLGAAPGANTLTASLPAFAGVASQQFTATGVATTPSITIVLPGGTIALGATIGLPIRLSAPAPAGGVTVSVTSDSTSYVTVASPGTVTFAAGDTLKTINVTGVAVGVSILHASATGYTAATAPVVVTPNVIVLGANVAVAVGSTATVSIQLVPAAASGLTVTLASTDTTKVRVTTPTVNFAAGQSSGSATVQGVAAGLAGVTATAPNYATGATLVTVGVAGQAAALTKFAGDNQTAQVGTAVPIPPAVKVTDILGAPVGNVSVTFTVASGGGSVTGATAQSNASGVATVGSWTLGGTAGTNTLVATSGALAPVTFTATGAASGIAATVVSPHATALTAFGQTFQLSAQAKDAAGNTVTGHFTWVSRTPAVATVDSTGKVTAVANGTSWVVATEAGGTRDSSQVTVTQTIAGITVTPGTRNIYLTRTFTFTAQAVDGLGNPMPGISTFTWSTTAPAVATVDTSVHGASIVATAVGLGSAQIRAASGAITGVANVSVITPITRIAVVVDTVGATKTDTFSMASLGLTRRYRAIAHDTLDAVMSGLSFTWASTNGSVASMNSFAGDTASVTSAANGVTRINATAQGFTSSPGALLTVSQVLASIALTPDASNPSATIAVGGTVHLSARGKDANSRFIPGGTFSYSSSAPSVATVDATGLVTGVSNGTASVTATSGAITSNAVTVTVGGAVPAIISFGRDTVAVGRGGSAQIPILLSKPAASPLIVRLTAPAFAHWSGQTATTPGAVTIPAGQTSVNATLFGDSAGTTTLSATDSSGLGYAAGSAIAKVTANLRLTSGSYGINATDIVSTQVLLSDPSPAGGTYVTFNYGTPGIARVSPDPAFIPQGQLAADIQIAGLAAGTTTITPSAIGVNGQSSTFTAYPPVLTPSRTTLLLGQGQYDPYTSVQVPASTNVPIVVTGTSSDSTTVTVTPSQTIPSNSYYVYTTISAKAIGAATVSFSAPGWTLANSVAVTSTTPHAGICCSNTSLFTTSPQQGFTVYAEDSTGTSHFRTTSLQVRIRSTDTTVIKPLDTLLTIAAGSFYQTGRYVVGATPGTAWLIVTASGHSADSTKYTVAGPPLALSWGGGTPRLGAGQFDPNQYVFVPNSVTSPLVVNLTSSDPTVATVPATVTIPAGFYYAYFNVTGVAPGAVTISAAATGYGGTSGAYVVTSPRLTACCSATYNNFGPSQYITVYASDSARGVHNQSAPLTVSLVSTDPSVITVDSSSVVIPAGQSSNSNARVTPVGVGTAKIIVSAAGHPALDTLTFTVQSPKLNFSIYSALLGRRQHFSSDGNGFYIYTPDFRSSPLALTIAQRHGNVDSLSTLAPTIASSTYYVYLDAFGLAFGTDTLIVSATGYLPDTAFITVTTPKFTAGGLPATTTTTNPPLSVLVYAADSLGSFHYTMDSVLVAATPSDSTVLQPTPRGFWIPKNAYIGQASVLVAGPGTANVTFRDSLNTGYQPVTTGNVTVTGPSLSISNSSPVLGMRQTGGSSSAYVYVPNNVSSPLVVNLASTDTRVVTVPASVTIPAGNYYAYFPITAGDTVGTVQVQATATGYGSASTNVQVTQPKFLVFTLNTANTTSGPQVISVMAADANGNTHFTTEDVAVTLQSSAPSVAAIDSTVVTIVSGGYSSGAARWSPGLVGTAQLSASDARSQFYKYNTGRANVQVITPTLVLSGVPGALGIGQYQDYVSVLTPDLQQAPLTVTLSHSGTARLGTYANQTNTPITQVTIPKDGYYAYFRVAGLSTGTDTLIVSATSPLHNPDTVATLVGLGRVDPIGNWPGSLKVGDSVLVTLYAYDQNQNAHHVVAATTFNLTGVSNIEFWSGGSSSVQLTSVTIPADASSVQFYVKGKTAGTGSVTVTGTNYQSYTTTVTVTP